MEWDVSEIVKKLRGELSEPGKKMTQAGFASFLNLRDPKPADEDDVKFVRPGDIQRLESAGTSLRGQFVIFLKLLPLCIESGLLGARDLLPPDKYELYKRLESREGVKTDGDKRRKSAR